MRREILFVILVGIVVGMGSSARGESPAVLLEKGIFAEETKGDLDGAISIYKQIIDDAKANRRYVAEAQYRLGVCHLKKGDKSRAAACFRAVLSKFPSQDKIVTRARERLGKIAPTTQPRLPKKEADNSDNRPTVVSTTPVALADDVDPSLKQISIMFDRQMMVGSWSWVGGGQTFPKTTGGPSYDSQSGTICTLPVKLEPGTVYWVGVNSPQHQNFKSADGVPARPYQILFATRSADGKPTSLPEDLVRQAYIINLGSSQLATNLMHRDWFQAAYQRTGLFLGALRQGMPAEPYSHTTPEYREAHQGGLERLAELMDLSKAKPVQVYVAMEAACVVVSPVRATGRDTDMSLGLGMIRVGKKYLVRDIDMLPNEQAVRQFVDGFHQAYPSGTGGPVEAPPAPTPLPPDMLAQAKEINARGRGPTPATVRPASTRRVGISATPPAVQRRYVGKTVADFPEKLDLSTPESAWAAYHRAGGRMNAKALVDVSWVKFDPEKLEKSWKRAGKEDMASYNKAQLDAAIVEVLTYRKSLARVTSYLKFPEGIGRSPYSLRTFGRIDGQWKNLGEDRVGSVDQGRKSFEKKKEILWRYFQRTKASVGAGPANKR